MNFLFSKVGYDSSLEGTSSFMMDFPASHSFVFFGGKSVREFDMGIEGCTNFGGNIYWSHTVDGRNPAPPGMYQTLQIMG